MKDIDSFVRQVWAMFPDPGCPEGWGPECTRVGCDECDDIRETIREKRRWRDWACGECRWCHPSLLGRAFQYYLPAFMVLSVTDCEDMDTAVEFAAWQFLSFSYRGVLPGEKLIRQFSEEQRELIYEWLGFYIEMEDFVDVKESYQLQLALLRDC